VTLLVDLTYAIYALLNGDLTLGFTLKVLSVAVIAGTVFLYFSGDLREDADAR
jgi:hypothetical protein